MEPGVALVRGTRDALEGVLGDASVEISLTRLDDLLAVVLSGLFAVPETTAPQVGITDYRSDPAPEREKAGEDCDAAQMQKQA
jgi:hypothetical protein